MNKFSFYKDGKALYCLIFMGFFLSFSSVYAKYSFRYNILLPQQHQIQGTVTDGTNPLPGVTIAVKSTSGSAAISDYNGQYTLSAAANDTLIVSFIGFKTALIPIQGRQIIDVKLLYDTTTLQEVRVNAGYYSVKESERTGSIARITSKDIESQPVTNVLATMQGRMAGVNVIQNTGMPGGGFTIEIRGQNSLRLDGNNPLYIIDDVPYSSQNIGSGYTSGNMPGQNSPLNSINPADVASIEVLKDADATAIYGSRGANGVVLITTKKGRKGKTAFSTNYSSGFGKVTGFMNLMDTSLYLAMRREAFINDGISKYPAGAYDINGTWDQTKNTNWQKELIGGTATYTNLQSSLTGGSAQTQFLLSGNYSRETTVFPGDFDYIKANGHLNINHESENKKFKISFSTGYTVQFNSLPSIDFTRDAISLAPNAPALYNTNGSLNWENNTFNNPVARLQGKIDGKTYDFLANALLTYDLGLGITVKSSFGYTNLNQNQLNLQPSTIYNPSFGLGSEASSVFSNNLSRSSWIIEPQLAWNHIIGSTTMEALVGTTFQQQNGNQLVSASEGFANNSLMENPASASIYLVLNSDENLYKYKAFFGRLNLNWKSRYILNLTARRDGSSRFGPGKQFATFGAIGGAWIFGEEHFIKENIFFVSFGKIRASYGMTGNDQIGDYQYLDTYNTSGNTYQGIAGLQPSRLFNPDFSWETNRKLEIAMETGFLNDRIFATFAWFRNRSSNQLVGTPLPGTTGFNQIQANLNAEVQNSGTEFSLRTVNIKSEHFNWTTSFNLTVAKNELLSFPGLETSTYKNRYVVGESVNIIKVYHYKGLDTSKGTYQFEDVNGDGMLSAADDKEIVRTLNPKYFGGLQNQLKYKNLQLDFLFQFVNQQNFNENFANGMPGTMVNQPIGVTAHWQNTGDSGPYQAYSSSSSTRRAANTQFSQSDAAITDASYIRLKNIALSFDLPQNWTKKFNCKLSLQGQNVLTITKYKGIDPEFRSSGFLPPLTIYTSSILFSF